MKTGTTIKMNTLFVLPVTAWKSSGAKRYIKATCLAIVLLLLNIPARSQNDGRSRMMVILPDKDVMAQREVKESADLMLYATRPTGRSRDKVIYMHFDLGAIPKGANIDEVELSLHLKSMVEETGRQFVQVFEFQTGENWQTITWDKQPVRDAVTDNMNAIAARDIKSENLNSGAHFSLKNVTDSWAETHKGSLWLLLTANTQQFTYYSTRSGDRSKQPKLIIRYHMPDQFQPGNSAQYRYNAQHTGQLEWQSNAVSLNFTGKIVANAGDFYLRSSPVYCNNELVFYCSSQDKKLHRLKAFSENGALLAENKNINGVVSFDPVADRGDKIYCVVNGDVIRVFDAKDSLRTVATKDLADNANIAAMPVVGFDGSLYISTDKGLYAYTPFPEFKVKWVYKADGHKLGTAALRDDERVVYVYDGGEKNTSSKGRLVALNNINGNERWAMGGLPTFEQRTPVPAVNDRTICLTGGIIEGKKCYIIKDDDTAGRVVRTITGDAISTPVLGGNKAFVINREKLQTYNLYDSGFVEYALDVTRLNAASPMVLDKDLNTYILSIKEGNQYLARMSTAFSGIAPVKFVPKVLGYFKDNALLITPTGKLFAWNDNFLYAFSPAFISEQNVITIPQDNAGIKSEYQYRSEKKIMVRDGTSISNIKNVVIHSRTGGVSFGKNFKVARGAQLRVLTQ